jgi:alpha-ketoglutarate-dependent taurine dioxygenase
MTVAIENLPAGFGVEVRGFDPSQLDDDATVGALQAAFDERGVLLFRDLDITHADQVRLCEQLIRRYGVTGDGNAPEDTWYISNKREGSAAPAGRLVFHADSMWAPAPFEVISLYGADVEEPAVPTAFTSAVEAWATLPDDLRARVEGREVLHTAADVGRRTDADILVSGVERPPSTVKPMPLVHPRTGVPILYACEQMTQEFVGMDHDESEELLEALFAHMYDPAKVWQHPWRNGDLVAWDNLAIQHARANVRPDGPARTLRKVASPMYVLAPDQMPTYSAVR